MPLHTGDKDFLYSSPAYGSENARERFCIHQLFERQVELTPDNIAIQYQDNTFTFLRLNQQANKLAYFLLSQHDINPDTIIGIMLDRSEKVVISVLAVLKTGAAYLPIDPNLPADRNSFICADAGTKIIITDNIPADSLKFQGVTFIDLNKPDSFTGSGQNLDREVHPENLAYVIFTSGSTGNPKGVMIEHHSVTNFINYNIQRDGITANDVFLNLNSFFFDAAVWELFVPLLTGARMIILEPGAQKYPEKILAAFSQVNITYFFLTPALLQVFLSYLEYNPGEIAKLSSLKRIIVGGEVLTPKLVNQFNNLVFKKTGAGLTNIYGPTETTVWVTAINCESDGPINNVSIGKPINNTVIYILDENLDELPHGEPGELVVGGAQVGRGYLNRKQLENEKFITNPFIAGEKLYRTGDWARYLPDGNLEFLGRMDNQVKLNGFRIELNEIENVILKNPHVKECVVLMQEVNDNNELAIYYTLNKTGNIDDVLINDIKEQLPAYMVPSFIIQLTAFPITTNGKIDRKNLPLPSHRYQKRATPYQSPSTATEKAVADFIGKSLNIASVGIDDNFFDLGIRSLLVTKIILSINNLFKTNITLSIFFQSSTIRQLSAYIESNDVDIKNPFVLLRKGTGDPLFLLPGAYGSPITFLAYLNNYNTEQPVYSITYANDDELGNFTNIQDLAKQLIVQIKLIKPKGPYHLIGYSFGGCLAFEMALQLQSEREEIGLLGIVSADAPLKRRVMFNYKLMRELAFLNKPNLYLLKKYFWYRVPFLLKTLLNKHAGVSTDQKRSNTSKLWESYTADLKYKGNIFLFYEDALEKLDWKFDSLDVYATYAMALLWQKQVDGKVIKYKVACPHDDLFAEPNVKKIAEVIKSYFDLRLKS